MTFLLKRCFHLPSALESLSKITELHDHFDKAATRPVSKFCANAVHKEAQNKLNIYSYSKKNLILNQFNKNK